MIGTALPSLLVAIAAAADDAREPVALPRVAHDLDARIAFVSTVIDEDRVAAGLGWKPDDSCADRARLDAARREFHEQVEVRREWLAARRARVDRRIGRTVVHVRTLHFELAFDIAQIKANRKTLRGADAALLYATRLEDYFDHVAASLNIGPERIQRELRYEVLLLDDKQSAETLATELLGAMLGTGWAVNHVGYPLSSTVQFDNPAYIRDDRERHQRLVHALAHLVYHDVGVYRNWLFDSHGWLYEGLAFRDEIALFGPPICSCDPDDMLELKHWLSEYWEANIRQALIQRRDPDPARVFAPGVGDLNAKDRQFAWSYVDFLLWHDAAKMAVLLEKAKSEQMPTALALETIYGMDLDEFQAAWRKFVTEHYVAKPRKGPTPPRAPRRAE